MDHNMQIFENAHFGKIRTIEKDGEVWFVGKDVSSVLGYSNPQKAIRDHVDEEDRTVNESFTVNGTRIVLINESGLYSLILSSKLPNVKVFKHWVTGEVLPTIRKHGAYITKELLEKLEASEKVAKKLFSDLKAKNNYCIDLENKLEEDAPKCEFYDKVCRRRI